MRGNTKKKKRTGLVVLLTLTLLLFLVLSLKIKTVTVTGNKRFTKEQVTELLFSDKLSRNTLFCYLQDQFKRHEPIPFIEDYRLVFHGPGEVEVIVYEKSVVGYVSYMSSYMYFDKDGIIVESANQELPDVPLISGLKFGQIVLYQKLPVEDEKIFQEILNLTQILTINNLQVERIQYSSLGEATLYLGGIEVLLGGNEHLNSKITELSSMLPQLEGRSGTLHLENYDETNSAVSTFQPNLH